MQTSGFPYTENIRSRRGMRLFVDVLVRNSISGYLDCWSMTTNTYVPLGNGPKKSTLTVCQTVLGNTDEVIGDCGLGFPVA